MRHQFSRTRIDAYIDRLRSSKDKRLRNSTFIGHHAGADRHAVFFPDDLWKNGLWLLGPARSGKTSKGIVLLASQLMHRSGHPNDGPLVVLDIKGDMAAFQSMRLEAHRTGRTFKWFTNEPQMTSYIFNPWDQRNLRGMTVSQKADGFANALGLWAGFGYGRLFFSMRDRNSLAETVQQAQLTKDANGWSGGQDVATAPTASSFVELAAEIDTTAKPGDTSSLVMVLKKVAETFQLNLHAGNTANVPEAAIRSAIQLPDILFPDEKGNYPVLYFFLRSQEIVTVSIIAKLVLFLLQNAIIQHRDAFNLGHVKTAPPNVKVMIDEWQHIATANSSVPMMLSQGGGQGLHFVLANQDLSQLQQGDSDLRMTAWENCGSKIIFGARSNELQKMLMEVSGEMETFMFGYGYDNEGRQQLNMAPCIRPVVERNRLVQMMARKEALCMLAEETSTARYGGHPFFITCPHRYTAKDYAVLSDAPWPGRSDEVIVPADFILPGRPPFDHFNER